MVPKKDSETYFTQTHTKTKVLELDISQRCSLLKESRTLLKSIPLHPLCMRHAIQLFLDCVVKMLAYLVLRKHAPHFRVEICLCCGRTIEKHSSKTIPN